MIWKKAVNLNSYFFPTSRKNLFTTRLVGVNSGKRKFAIIIMMFIEIKTTIQRWKNTCKYNHINHDISNDDLVQFMGNGRQQSSPSRIGVSVLFP